MLEIYKILSATIIGTSLMTLFSYFAANQWKSPFREPALLNKLLYRSPFYKWKTLPVLPGWFFHYFIGLMFVVAYHLLWTNTSISPTVINGLILGFISGFIGIAGWILMFSIHPDPPFVNSRKYYPHLLAAHVIFGAGAVFGYELIG